MKIKYSEKKTISEEAEAIRKFLFLSIRWKNVQFSVEKNK